MRLEVTDGRTLPADECERAFKTHSYLDPPYWRFNKVLSMQLVMGSEIEDVYHLAMMSHQPSHESKLPFDDVIPYRDDEKKCIMLSRLSSGPGEASLRNLMARGRTKGHPLEKFKSELLQRGIQYAFEKRNAGVVIDYINKTEVNNLSEACRLIHSVCEEITPFEKLKDIGTYLRTTWVHSKYV